MVCLYSWEVFDKPVRGLCKFEARFECVEDRAKGVGNVDFGEQLGRAQHIASSQKERSRYPETEVLQASLSFHRVFAEACLTVEHIHSMSSETLGGLVPSPRALG